MNMLIHYYARLDGILGLRIASVSFNPVSHYINSVFDEAGSCCVVVLAHPDRTGGSIDAIDSRFDDISAWKFEQEQV